MRAGTSRPLRAIAVFAVCVAALTAGSGAAYAAHWYKYGWRDQHKNYPVRPSGLAELNATFGNACNDNAGLNRNLTWYGRLPDGTEGTYVPRYHKKLGGNAQSDWFEQTAGTGSNLEDIKGHLGDAHALDEVRGGVWGYLCRKISNSTKYSVHSWGAAFDINAAWEHYGHDHNHTITSTVNNTWQDHRWYWGRYFNMPYTDSMHYQYVTNY